MCVVYPVGRGVVLQNSETVTTESKWLFSTNCITNTYYIAVNTYYLPPTYLSKYLCIYVSIYCSPFISIKVHYRYVCINTPFIPYIHIYITKRSTRIGQNKTKNKLYFSDLSCARRFSTCHFLPFVPLFKLAVPLVIVCFRALQARLT